MTLISLRLERTDNRVACPSPSPSIGDVTFCDMYCCNLAYYSMLCYEAEVLGSFRYSVISAPVLKQLYFCIS